MAREIKFRAWDQVEKRFYIPVIRYKSKINSELWYGSEIQGETSDPIMQYTGLKDKNGKEIYEGDIVKSRSIFGVNNSTGFVTYFQNRFLIRNEIEIIQEFSEPEFECVVVGNIYENYELLEGA